MGPLDNCKEVIEGLESTNEQVIDHKQSEILRVLTAISVIVQPLTSHRRRLRHERRLPGEGTSDAFFVLPRRRGRALLAMVGFFRWKKWL